MLGRGRRPRPRGRCLRGRRTSPVDYRDQTTLLTETEFFDVVGTTDAAGGARLDTPARVVDTALRTLDRRNPPPSVAVGMRNRVALAAERLVTRRRTVLMLAAMTKPAAAR